MGEGGEVSGGSVRAIRDQARRPTKAITRVHRSERGGELLNETAWFDEVGGNRGAGGVTL